jgi:hypothetical protein
VSDENLTDGKVKTDEKVDTKKQNIKSQWRSALSPTLLNALARSDLGVPSPHIIIATLSISTSQLPDFIQSCPSLPNFFIKNASSY